jgi:hypothetical protein
MMGPPATINGFLQKNQRSRWTAFLVRTVACSSNMRFSSFADVGNNLTAMNLAVTLAEETKQRQKSAEPVS